LSGDGYQNNFANILRVLAIWGRGGTMFAGFRASFWTSFVLAIRLYQLSMTFLMLAALAFIFGNKQTASKSAQTKSRQYSNQ
jgi:hypothetical protein